MMRAAWALLLCTLLCGCASQAMLPDTADSGERLLVTIHFDATDSLHGNPAERYRRPGGYGAGPNAVPVLDALAADYAIRRVGGWPMRALGVHCEVFAAASGANVDAIVARLAKDPRVDSAEPMHAFHTLTLAGDAYRPLQHSLDTLQIDAAHALSRGSGVRVAVIDSGIDSHHPDLAGAVDVKRDYTAGPLAPHGTEVAGVIAARYSNGVGIIGVAPEAELADLRACASAGGGNAASCDSYTLAQALDFAVSSRIDVINLSLAGPYDPLLARLLAAAESNGIPVVAAAPPPGDERDQFPASVPTVIAVANLEDAVHGSPAFVRAPGIDVLTTFPGNRYDYGSGSSLASAHVSGLVALMRSLDRSLSPLQIRTLLNARPQLSAVAVLKDEAARFAQQ